MSNFTKSLYLGKAGERYVMSEFLARGWNVAMPDVDIGDDIFVVGDNLGIFQRIQVKTAQATVRENGYSAQFNISIKSLKIPLTENLHFVLVVRKDNQWTDLLILKSDILLDFYENSTLSDVPKENIVLYFSFQGQSIMCSKVDFTSFRSNFSNFPELI